MSKYHEQVRILLQVLPLVATENCFALKGGTAINFFIRDFPRLSVDIDLVYVPIEDRNTTLTNIDKALSNISGKIKKLNFQVSEKVIIEPISKQSIITKLIVSNSGNLIKIEPNLTIRGTVYPIENKSLVKAVENKFGLFAEINTLSIHELYAGKICAALDRQHPRDLFDIKLLFENEGINEKIHKAFIVYLLSHNRPIHELLNPNFKDIKDIFNKEFQGMTEMHITLDELIETRQILKDKILSRFTDKEKQFLLSFKKGVPEWDLLELPDIDKFPSIKWKLQNINSMPAKKQKEQLLKLEAVLNI